MSNTQSIAASEVDNYYDGSVAAELGLTRAEFRDILLDVISHTFPGDLTRSSAQLLATLRWDELLIARACARGYETAWNRFLILYRPKLYAAAKSIAKDDVLARELADSLYADLFGTSVRADGNRVSKLESYMGRGSLEGWLRTVLAQAYVNRFRSQKRFTTFDETTERKLAATVAEPESGEQEQVAKATDAALAELSSGERLLLATYYLDGRTLAEIGRMFGMHESTVSRRLEKITAALRKRIIAKLCAVGITTAEAKKLLALDVRDLGVDVRRGLAQERQAGTF